jgi:hypothetical protein
MTENRPARPRDDLSAPIQRLMRGIGAWAERNTRAFEMIVWALSEIGKPPDGQEADLRGTERLLRRIVPANWLEMRIGLQEAARRTMAEAGIRLAWVPRPDVIAAIVATKGHEGRDLALVANQAEILADLEAALADVMSRELTDLTDSARQAVEAYRAGLRRPAQALAGAAITTVLTDHFGEGNFAEARRRLTPRPPAATDLRVARRAMLEWCLLAAIGLSYTEPSPGFNRHLTAHRVGPEQYSDPNALAGLMLLVGLLRELHEIYAIGDHGIPLRLRQRPRAGVGTSDAT